MERKKGKKKLWAMLIIQFHPYMLGMVGFVDAACAPKNPSYKPRLFNIMATWYLIHIYYYSIQPLMLEYTKEI